VLEQRIRARTAEIERARADLAQIAHAAAHDLVEPVRTVHSYVQLLAQRHGATLGEEGGQYVRYVVEAGERARALLEGLLGFAEAATATRADAVADCQAVVARVVHQLDRRIADAGASVTVDPLPTVAADPGQLAQVFRHLLDNALKFHAGPAPRIHVRAERGDGEWCFSVADDGIGVPPEHRGRIFALFAHLHHRHEYTGNGIGLGVCRRLVELHGGRIWVDPNPEGAASSASPSPIVGRPPRGPNADLPALRELRR
jgi:light-regulated signal transduction histidine kinase (bacteriophytochrome)